MKIRIAILALVLAMMSFAPAEPSASSYFLPIVTNGCLELDHLNIIRSQSAHALTNYYALVDYPMWKDYGDPEYPNLPDYLLVYDGQRIRTPIYFTPAYYNLQINFNADGANTNAVHTLTVIIYSDGLCAAGQKDFIYLDTSCEPGEPNGPDTCL